MGVGEALGLDVARLVEEALDKALAAPEGGEGLAGCGIEEFGDLLDGARHLEAATAAAEGRLDGHGQTVLLREGDHLVGRLNGIGGAGHQGGAGALRDVARAHLVAKGLDGRGAGADPGEARLDDGAREVGVLGEEAVAGVHRLGAGAHGDVDELGDVEVGVARRRAAERERLVGEANVGGVAVGVRVDGDGREPGVFTRADDANCDLSAVGDEHRVEGSHWATVAPWFCAGANGPVGGGASLACGTTLHRACCRKATRNRRRSAATRA